MANYNTYALDKEGNPLFTNGKPDLENGDLYISVSQILSMENPGDFLTTWLLRTFGGAESGDQALQKYRDHMDKVSRLGTAIHRFVELDLKGEPYEDPIGPDMLPGIESYYDWKNKHKIKVIESERILHSKRFRFAGTLDILLEIDGKRYFADLKTGSVYDKAFVQLSAYKYMAKEMGLPNVDDADLLVIGGADSKSKIADGGAIQMHTLDTMFRGRMTEEDLFSQFMCLRHIWYMKNTKVRKFEPIIKGMSEALDPMVQRFKEAFKVPVKAKKTGTTKSKKKGTK